MESFRPKAKRLCAGVMILLGLSLRHKLVLLYLLAWVCGLSSAAVLIWSDECVCVYWRKSQLHRHKSWCVCMCVCVCARASIPQGPLLFPASFYKRRDSERAADVEALTFMVAKAQARVKRHAASPTPQSLKAAAPCPPACTHTHCATLAG